MAREALHDLNFSSWTFDRQGWAIQCTRCMKYCTPCATKSRPCTARSVLKRGSLVDGASSNLAFDRLIYDGDELKKREERHSLKLAKTLKERLADPEKKRTNDRSRYARDRLTVLKKLKEK